MDLNLGENVVKVGQSYVNRGFKKINIINIRKYFKINNKYVLRKISLLLFPYFQNEWNEDIDSLIRPDLYIPIMSFITILLYGLKMDLKNEFSPEKLSLKTTKCIILELILTFIFKLITYFVNININYLDYLSFSGYKFVLIIFKMAKIPYLKYLLSTYSYFTYFFFISRCLKGRFGYNTDRRQKVYIIFFVAFLEIIFMYLIS
ncbi:Protein transport protein yif1 [Dictyocoela muelleri]|nr:Protein transport protein yif1 [Dictyocoela muelleri]